jgi:hypothetical protein
MDTDGETKWSKIEYFAVDVDGVRKRDQLNFAAAVQAAMEFRQRLPKSIVHVCDADAPSIAPT